VPGHPEVYVTGDLAYLEENGHPLPMVAPVAVQQGGCAARNIINQISGRELQEFRYRDRGTMVTIGRNAGVVRIGTRVFTGLLAWILWLGVHLLNLIGFRNRLLVMINWSIDYFLFERAVRFIFPSEKGLFAKALRCSTTDQMDDNSSNPPNAR
jgi:NADH dehydrogenase